MKNCSISKPKWKKIKAAGTTLHYQQGGDPKNEEFAKKFAALMNAGAKERKAKAKAIAKAAPPPPDLRPKPYLVAFIDILGFGHELEKAATEDDMTRVYAKIHKVQEEFQLPSASQKPQHQLQNNADYSRRVIALSDAVVIAITPNCEMESLMGGYDLLGFALYELALAQGICACQGIFVRGGISHGPFFFQDDVLISPALVRAYDLETNAAKFPIIVVPESTRDEVLAAHRMGSNGPGAADPTLRLFKKFGRRKWRNQRLYFLDYIGVMLRDSGSAANFLNLHRRKIEEAYNATSSEKVRKKYRWLMKYHNESFDNGAKCLRDKVINMGNFPEPKKRKTKRRKTAK